MIIITIVVTTVAALLCVYAWYAWTLLGTYRALVTNYDQSILAYKRYIDTLKNLMDFDRKTIDGIAAILNRTDTKNLDPAIGSDEATENDLAAFDEIETLLAAREGKAKEIA